MATGDEYNLTGQFPDSTINIKSTIIQILDHAITAPNVDFHAVGSVFLSSTFSDFREYRDRVAEDLNKLVGLFCPLIDYEVIGRVDVIEACKQRVFASHIFMGFFAYWYGSIPPGHNKSITQMEFEWATIKMDGVSSRPMIVFEPKPDSHADKELREKATHLITNAGYDAGEHGRLLELFRAVYKNWHTVQFFEDKHDLAQRACIFGAYYKGATFVAAAKGQVKVEEVQKYFRKVTDEELGQLGRKKQFDIIEGIFADIINHPDTPAIACVVSGRKDAGQEEFLRRLIKTRQLKRGRQVRDIKSRPPIDNYGLTTLIQWVGENLGVSKGKTIETIAELAELINSELKNQQLCFVLDRIDLFPGSVTMFYTTFWKPFCEELRKLRAIKAPENRLIAILVDYTEESIEWQSVTTNYDPDADVDYSKLILLPTLEKFTRKNLANWLEVVEVPENRRAKLVEIAIKNSRGEEDGTPDEVFDRLRCEMLWPNEGKNHE